MSEKQTLFRTAMVGGYNKKDVQEYIASLEKEVERLKSVEDTAKELETSVAEILEKQKEEKPIPSTAMVIEKAEFEALKEDAEHYRDGIHEMKPKVIRDVSVADDRILSDLKVKAQKYDETYDAVKQLLLDSRIDAQVVLTNARQQALKIKEDAQAEADGIISFAKQQMVAFATEYDKKRAEMQALQDTLSTVRDDLDTFLKEPSLEPLAIEQKMEDRTKVEAVAEAAAADEPGIEAEVESGKTDGSVIIESEDI